MFPHILVVDPDIDIRRSYCDALRNDGFDVEEADDGRDALVKALTNPPSLLVSELQLPLVDGVALCDALRHDRATADVPILIVTRESNGRVIERVTRVGVDDVLVKPVPPERVRTRTHELLEKSSMLRQRSAEARTRATAQLDKSAALLERAQTLRRPMLSRTHHRFTTNTPPLSPPDTVCPQCDLRLTYDTSHVGGVSAKHPEQWDYFKCANGCGTFQYRHRTRRLRRV